MFRKCSSLPVSLFLHAFAFTSSLWTDSVLESTMASAPVATSTKSSLREDLTCAICCDLFREPVMLACMHHFCKPCISRYWRGTQGTVTCPQCRKEFSSKQFQTNYLVAAMVEKVRATTSDSYMQNLKVSLQPSVSPLTPLHVQPWPCWLTSTQFITGHMESDIKCLPTLYK